MALVVKHSSVNAGDIRDMGSIPGSEDRLEKGMATYFSIFDSKSPGKSSLADYGPLGRLTMH